MLERDEAAEDRLLPDREADAVAELEGESSLLIGEAELLGPRPDRHHLVGRHPGTDQADGGIQEVAAALVGIDQRR